MDQTEFIRSVEDLMEAAPGSLTGQSVLEDQPGWNSLAVMGFIAFADEDLGVLPVPRAIKGCRTLADLMALVGV
jgi:acyl carrier protein